MEGEKEVRGLTIVEGEEGSAKPAFKCQVCHETIEDYSKGIVIWADKDDTAFVIHKGCLDSSPQQKSMELGIFMGRAELGLGLSPDSDIMSKLRTLGQLE